MSWSNGDIRNLFLKLKSKLELQHVIPTTTETSPKKFTLTLVEMQLLKEIEKTDSREKSSHLKSPIYNDRRKIGVKFKTDSDKLNTVVYRHRKNLYLKYN